MKTPGASKPGRNAPCWCGSGLKYKKCHRDGDSLASRRPGPAGKPDEASSGPERKYMLKLGGIPKGDGDHPLLALAIGMSAQVIELAKSLGVDPAELCVHYHLKGTEDEHITTGFE